MSFNTSTQSAIRAGAVDFRGTPGAIARELLRLRGHPYVAAAPLEGDKEVPEPNREQSLALALALLRQHAGIDFSGYKRTTVLRRIVRRMALRHTPTLKEYANALRLDPLKRRPWHRTYSPTA